MFYQVFQMGEAGQNSSWMPHIHGHPNNFKILPILLNDSVFHLTLIFTDLCNSAPLNCHTLLPNYNGLCLKLGEQRLMVLLCHHKNRAAATFSLCHLCKEEPVTACSVLCGKSWFPLDTALQLSDCSIPKLNHWASIWYCYVCSEIHVRTAL